MPYIRVCSMLAVAVGEAADEAATTAAAVYHLYVHTYMAQSRTYRTPSHLFPSSTLPYLDVRPTMAQCL